MQNPDWSRDELILALDFYLKHRARIPSNHSREITDLSNKLRHMNRVLGIAGNEKFRNNNGVYRKMMNLRSIDPDYNGVGLPHGSEEEKVVWKLYADKPKELEHLASSILSFVSNGHADEVGLANGISEFHEAEEGTVLTRIHTIRERNATLVSRKKAQFKDAHSHLFCEVCGFDFEKTYGAQGEGFIECHHTRAVSELKPGDRTKVADLTLVCSNCHRMIHRKRPWLSIEDLRELIIQRDTR